MDKKIGLVSYHRDPNYGTMLQAFALAYAIKEIGGSCEYLNYYEYIQPSLLKTFISYVYKHIRKFCRFKRKEDFDFFNDVEFASIMKEFKKFHEQYIPCSKKEFYYDTIWKAEDYYKFFIVGSDQTWSQEVNKIGTTINFLDFVQEKYKKRSYAPSIGSVHLDSVYVDFLVSKLSKFQYLSCRERPNCETLGLKLDNKIEFVLDPTLLLKPSDWLKYTPKPIIEGEYIIAYILGKRTCISEYAENLGRLHNIPVYYILTRPDFLQKENILKHVGPFDFINLIRYSKFVVTDSFHGTVFSLNFQRDFYSFAKRDGGIGTVDNDRILVLLQEFNLTERFITDECLMDIPPIDYTEVNHKLANLRSSSIGYLKQIIK